MFFVSATVAYHVNMLQTDGSTGIGYRGLKVLIIFGNFSQGSDADYRGHVLGVIGDRNLPLRKVRDETLQYGCILQQDVMDIDQGIIESFFKVPTVYIILKSRCSLS